MTATTFDLDKGIVKLVEAISLPIITWPGGEGSLTEEQKTRITAERFAKNARFDFSDAATDFEVCVYMMTRSLAAPLDQTGYKIYMHAFKTSLPEQFKALFPDAEATLDEHEQSVYNDLKRWIYKEQVKGRKKSSKQEVAEA